MLLDERTEISCRVGALYSGCCDHESGDTYNDGDCRITAGRTV